MNAAEQNQRRINRLRAEEKGRGSNKGTIGHTTAAQRRRERENAERMRGTA
jgi:hypothetical protein